MRSTDSTAATILHVITGLKSGGAEAALYALSTHDSNSNHHVVSLMDEGKYGPLLRAAGVSVTTLDMPRGKVTLTGLLRLFKVVKRLKPVAVQTWMYHADLIGGVIAKLAGARNIAWGIRHSYLVPGKSSSSTVFIAKINALLSKFVPDVIVCCAHKALEAHAEMGYSREKMMVIPNGYDMKVFFADKEKRRTTRSSLGLEDETPSLGFVARFDPLKDHETLIKALAIVQKVNPSFRVVLVGNDIDATNETLVESISAANLTPKVMLLGLQTDIPGIMNALDIHVMSSSSEGFPNVLAEAMACGTPCVSTDVGDAQMIIGNTGWLVPPKNPQKLAEAIIEALDEHKTGLWEKRRNAAIERVRSEYDVKTMVRRYRTEAWGLPDDTNKEAVCGKHCA